MDGARIDVATDLADTGAGTWPDLWDTVVGARKDLAAAVGARMDAATELAP